MHPAGTEPLADPVLMVLESSERRRVVLLALHGEGIDVATLAPGKPVVLGRSAPADFCVDDRNLSRRHARFLLHDDRSITVEDLGSMNGTFVAGARIERARLRVGDEVRLGGTTVRAQAIGDRTGADAEDWSKDETIVAGAALRPVLETAVRAASSRIPVLLQGETGAGKEVIARVLHAKGPRASRRMVSVNCAAIPSTLVEATLFGHERGAFTGAMERRRGVFEEADGGTVFLDEIGELAPPAQAALLRVLEAGRFQRIGSTREVEVDVRVVAATHRDLEAMSERGELRRDLFFRLSAMVIAIPPLRARKDEIPLLAERFLRQANLSDGRDVKGIADDAMAALVAHDWPGNVRELRNAIERAVVVARTDVIRVEDLPLRVLTGGRAGPGNAPPPAPGVNGAVAFASAPKGHLDGGDVYTPGGGGPGAGAALPDRVQGFERRIIVEALEAAGWRRAEAARRLGVPVRTLAYRIRALGIEEPPR